MTPEEKVLEKVGLDFSYDEKERDIATVKKYGDRRVEFAISQHRRRIARVLGVSEGSILRALAESGF